MPLSDEQIEEYLAMVEEWDGTREEKIECIRHIFAIMEMFVDLAFETDPVSLALKAQERAAREGSPIPDRDELAEMYETLKRASGDSVS